VLGTASLPVKPLAQGVKQRNILIFSWVGGEKEGFSICIATAGLHAIFAQLVLFTKTKNVKEFNKILPVVSP
jgi:hypothetical protein